MTSIFSFSHNVFYPFKVNLNFWLTITLSPANGFNLDRSKILLFGKGLIFLTHALTEAVNLTEII